MPAPISRRHLLWGAALAPGLLRSQQPPALPVMGRPAPPRSTVALANLDNRRKAIVEALESIDEQIRPVLKRKKYVVIKPNNVSTVNPLAATNAEALRGILDYLEPRFKGPVVIAESSAGETLAGFENFGYNKLPAEYRSLKMSLVDLNQEAKYDLIDVLDDNLHTTPVRLAARLLDPDAYVISSAILKTHNTVIATLGVKNMTLGAPLHQPPGETPKWNDKRKYHYGVRQTHYNMLVTAQRMAPRWNLSVIDGYEGMEGNGPASGTPVPSRIAIASTDFIAADRVAVDAMAIDPDWMGYLKFCAQAGIGNWDLAKIDVRGARVETVKKPYRMHKDIERELQWMGPMTDLPPKLG